MDKLDITLFQEILSVRPWSPFSRYLKVNFDSFGAGHFSG